MPISHSFPPIAHSCSLSTDSATESVAPGALLVGMSRSRFLGPDPDQVLKYWVSADTESQSDTYVYLNVMYLTHWNNILLNLAHLIFHKLLDPRALKSTDRIKSNFTLFTTDREQKTTDYSPTSSPLLPVSCTHGSLSLQKKTARAFSVCSSGQPQQCLPSATRLGVSPGTSAAGPLYGWPSAKEGVTSAWPCPPVVLDPLQEPSWTRTNR